MSIEAYTDSHFNLSVFAIAARPGPGLRRGYLDIIIGAHVELNFIAGSFHQHGVIRYLVSILAVSLFDYIRAEYLRCLHRPQILSGRRPLDNTVISSYVSVLSGARQHDFSKSGKSVLDGPEFYSRLKIGSRVFIGEKSLIMADLGDDVVIGAGSVVVKEIPDSKIAVGNPARVVKDRTPAAAQN